MGDEMIMKMVFVLKTRYIKMMTISMMMMTWVNSSLNLMGFAWLTWHWYRDLEKTRIINSNHIHLMRRLVRKILAEGYVDEVEWKRISTFALWIAARATRNFGCDDLWTARCQRNLQRSGWRSTVAFANVPTNTSRVDISFARSRSECCTGLMFHAINSLTWPTTG